MVGYSSQDQDIIKDFITTEVDEYRVPYAVKPERRPRRCILVATTNKTDGIFNDATGNRRYLPVYCHKGSSLTPFMLTDTIIKQIWAEAYQLYLSGTIPLYFDGKLLQQAKQVQRENLVTDDRESNLAAYLDMYVPKDWYDLTIAERLRYIKAETANPEGQLEKMCSTNYMQRQHISNIEIRVEFLGRELNENCANDKRDIKLMMAKLPNWNLGDKRCHLKFYNQQRCYERILA